MWRKLRKQIAVEREMLGQLLADHQPLLSKCAASAPDRIEVSALAAMLHGFYGGVENIFRRVAIELNEPLPRGQGWHKDLLESMTRPGPQRPALISGVMAETLRGYLEFRHFFRSGYPFQLRWERMAGLVHGCEEALSCLEGDLESFLKATESKQ